MKVLCLCLLLFYSFISPAQTILLEGKVTNQSGEGIPMAYLKLKKNKITTLTDLNGVFSFRVNEKHKSDTLQISYLGFKTKEIAINNFLLNKTNEIQLEEDVRVLSEVEISVSQKETDPVWVVRNMLEKAHQNYPHKPLQYKLFNRVAYQQGKRYTYFMESLSDVYEEEFEIGFKALRNFKMKLLAVRRTTDSSLYIVTGKRDFRANVNFQSWDELRSEVPFMKEDVLFNWIFKLDSTVYPNNKKHFVISAFLNEKPTDLKTGATLFKLPDKMLLHVHADNFALSYLECNYKLDSLFTTIRDTKKYHVKGTTAKTIYSFKQIEDKWYPDYHYFKDDYVIYSNRKHTYMTNFAIIQESFVHQYEVNESFSEQIDQNPFDYTFKSEEELYDSASLYNPTIWKELIYETPLYYELHQTYDKTDSLKKDFIKQGEIGAARKKCYQKFRNQIFTPLEYERLMQKCIQEEIY